MDSISAFVKERKQSVMEESNGIQILGRTGLEARKLSG